MGNRLKSESFFRLAMLQKENEPPIASDRERVDNTARLLKFSLNVDASQESNDEMFCGGQMDANFHLGMQHFQEASTFFSAAVRVAPEFVEAVNNLGVAYDLSGQWNDAVRTFQRALSLRPGMQEAVCNLCIARINLWSSHTDKTTADPVLSEVVVSATEACDIPGLTLDPNA
ncbi:hypothetical protein T484DRAFT_1789433 [Baffinella frigidus]|nr:hypothetical protein T484DRAFT_1789433 [Cryptophyta sp. CCMP2293]